MSIRIALPGSVYSKSAQVTTFFDRLLAEINTLPGVLRVGAVSDLPLGATSNNILAVEGQAQRTQKVETIYCAGNALESVGVLLLQGRLLQPADDFKNQRVAVVSETFARQVWPRNSAVGRHIKFGVEEKEPWMTVVGVVKDMKNRLTSDSPRSMMFTRRADWVNEMNVLVRTSGDPLSLAGAIRHQVKQLDPSLPIGKIETLDQVLNESLSAERFRTMLLVSFALAALLLAMLGIAGLLAYNTAQRTQEFGVRLALGADRRDLLLLVFRHCSQLCGSGIAIGLVVSVVVTRGLSTLLYDTCPHDLGTFVAVPSILALVALGAAMIPAWRAVHTDPMTALRAE